MAYHHDSMSAPSGAKIYSFQDGLLYTAMNAVTSYTQRHPGVILVSLDDTPLVIRTQYQHVSGKAIIVAPQVKRCIEAENCRFAAIHIEPSNPYYRSFLDGDLKQAVKAVDYEHFAEFLPELNACYGGSISFDRAQSLFSDLLLSLTPVLGAPLKRDSRIEWLLHGLLSRAPSDYAFEELIEEVGLSAGRLSHLFTGEVGVSLRSFLMWRKTKEVIALVNSEMNLTDIAHASGFSDSAHLSRTFSNTLGVLPSMLRDDRCIQVINTAA